MRCRIILNVMAVARSNPQHVHVLYRLVMLVIIAISYSLSEAPSPLVLY